MGRAIQIDIDCADPEALAGFCAEVLSYEVAEPHGFESWPAAPRRFVAQRGGDPETRWAIVDAEVDRLVGLGATKLRRANDTDQCFVVMADPEGNEFCVCG